MCGSERELQLWNELCWLTSCQEAEKSWLRKTDGITKKANQDIKRLKERRQFLNC
jgi:hypothetical protein